MTKLTLIDSPGAVPPNAKLLHVRARNMVKSTPGGMAPLTDVEAFLARFVAYPSEHARVAHVLWIAHAHAIEAFEATPRLAFLSPEPASGKTRALELTELLVPRPVPAVNASAAYLFRRVGVEADTPTVLFDEIDSVFGPKAKNNEEIRAFLNAGHRRGALACRCAIRGKTIETEELAAFCAVALAGLGHLPDTILSRAVVIRMRRRGSGEVLENFRRRIISGDAEAIRSRLADWAANIVPSLKGAFPSMPKGVHDRDADVWEPLIAVADAAGEEWAERARTAATVLVAAAKESSPSLGVRLLSDIKVILGDAKSMATTELLQALNGLVESPWGDLRGAPLSDRGLARYLSKYDIRPKTLRIGAGTQRGYSREQFNEAWDRYLPKA